VKPTLFVSDLHLDESRPGITAQFERFLEGPAAKAAALYILGDLFEYWVGDDSLDMPLAQRIALRLEDAAVRCPVYFMHGNRDFLIAERFAEATGVKLLEDPTVIELYGRKTVLLHGDTLCTDDQQYQAFRKMVRDPTWQSSALARPIDERLAIAQDMRLRSEGAKDGKPMALMDVSPATVERVFRETGADVMIHGHTHRPAKHESMVDGRKRPRWVLADWYDRGSYLEVSADGTRAVETF
jgi:UDP-2,3-diacylglucosamine hydrolase